MSERNIAEDLSLYYREVMEQDGGEHSEEEVRLSVVANFVNAYMSSIYQNIYEANTREERMAAVFTLEMMKNIEQDFSSLTADMTVDEKIEKMVQVLTNVSAPSYDNVKTESVRVTLIDSAVDDFTVMAEFLRG